VHSHTGLLWYSNTSSYEYTYGACIQLYHSEYRETFVPAGCTVPTDADWTALTSFLGGESVAGGKLKEIGTTY